MSAAVSLALPADVSKGQCAGREAHEVPKDLPSAANQIQTIIQSRVGFPLEEAHYQESELWKKRRK